MDPWMQWLRNNLGARAITGILNNPFIMRLFGHTDTKPTGDETPWCAATLCSALEETGYSSPHSALAASFIDYGLECDLMPGCIIVFKWDTGHYHVTCCDHIVNENLVAGIGGNQNGELNISIFGRKHIVATRWPVR